MAQRVELLSDEESEEEKPAVVSPLSNVEEQIKKKEDPLVNTNANVVQSMMDATAKKTAGNAAFSAGNVRCVFLVFLFFFKKNGNKRLKKRRGCIQKRSSCQKVRR